MSLATETVAFLLFFFAQAATAALTAVVSGSPDEAMSTFSSFDESDVSEPALAESSLLNPPPPHAVSTIAATAVIAVAIAVLPFIMNPPLVA
ncbi:hypothetical protein BPY_04850 [Bifidobacterium psychraerophilum]